MVKVNTTNDKFKMLTENCMKENRIKPQYTHARMAQNIGIEPNKKLKLTAHRHSVGARRK